ncbi:hypothetical protein [Nocardia sp. R6R-6]|uniref:hypothetical protein n=1 Tax=Nocardia sp. R6R-6 TaxID=3459303 RepID=UPI00403E2891
MVSSTFSHGKSDRPVAAPSPGPNVPASLVRLAVGTARWWRTHAPRTALWQQALFSAPDLAGAGVHPALLRQLEAEATA